MHAELRGLGPQNLGMLLAALATLGACSGSGQPSAASNAQPGEARLGAAGRTITIGIIQETTGIGPFHSHTSGGGAQQVEEIAMRYLVGLDAQSRPYPELAVELPSLDNGSWIIYPDGSMQTTYRLRPNAYWHDGMRSTADDWVFGWEVDRDPQLPNFNAVPMRYIHSAVAPDDFTLVLHWSETYPFANALSRRAVSPLQRVRHEAVYRSDKDRFVNSPAWNSELIGLGPYRVAAWTHGSEIRFERFADYFRGAPKIETIIVRFLQDPNTLMANILSDSIDVYLPLGLERESAVELRHTWAPPGSGNQVLVYPDGRLRYLEVQWRTELQRPKTLADRRVREAIYRTTDRQQVLEVISGGLGAAADSWVGPDDPLRATLFRGVIPDYSRDLRAAQTLMEAVGYRRAADGSLVDAQSGERFETAVWNTRGGGRDKENAIISDQLGTLGIASEQYLIPAARMDDNEHRASFPGLNITSRTVTLDFENAVLRYRPPARTQPLGSPRNGYNSPAVITLVDQLQVTVAEDKRAALQREIMALALQELPILPLYWDVETMTIGKGISGPQGRTGRHVNYPLATWNVHEWSRS